MTEREVIVKSDAGVHARPAMMIVKEAMKYSCEVRLVKDDVEADCKSIMSVLGLAIISGTRLIVKANGEGESRVTVETAAVRNRFVAALADALFVAHAAPGGRTEEMCREAIGWGKGLYTFEDRANENLLAMGAVAVEPGMFLKGLPGSRRVGIGV